MARPRSNNVQFHVRISEDLDERLRDTAERMPHRTSPQELCIRGMELAITEAEEIIKRTKKR